MGRRCRKLGPRPPCFGRSCSFHRRGASCCSFPWVGGQGGAARDGPLCRTTGRCVCGGARQPEGLGSAHGGSSHLRSRLGNEANLGGQTANNLRLSVVRVGVRVETRRSFSRTFPTQLAHLAPYCQSRSSSVSRGSTPQPSHRCASKPAFFLNRGPRLGSVTLRFPNRREEAKM